MSTPSTEEHADVRAHIDMIAERAYYEVMSSRGILGILHDRETVPDDVLLALTPDDVNDLYDWFIGPAIDSIETHLLS